jgi:uncharacterized phage protein gp47/JayE
VTQYLAILAWYVTNYSGIYGQGAYTGIPASDYQLLSILALAASDQSNAAVLAYNQRAPSTAVGSGLDGDAAYNGLIREAASYSTVGVTLSGTAGTIITNGAVRDLVPGQGYLWNLPTSVQIGSGGTVSATATCTVIGAVQCGVGQISGSPSIATPTAGWTGVNNPSAASTGQPVETDTQFRARQAVSTEQPSETLLAGTQADVLAVSGVTAALCMENPTGSTLSAWPIAVGNPFWFGPAHSITAIVAGGAALAIATAIYTNKGIGCGINSTTYTGTGGFTSFSGVPISQQVTDPNTGQLFTIYYYAPVEIPIYVEVTVNPITSAYGPNVAAAIVAAIVNYLNGLALGQTVSQSALVAAVMAVNSSLSSPVFDVTSLEMSLPSSPLSYSAADIVMQWPMFAAQGLNANVFVTS